MNAFPLLSFVREKWRIGTTLSASTSPWRAGLIVKTNSLQPLPPSLSPPNSHENKCLPLFSGRRKREKRAFGVSPDQKAEEETKQLASSHFPEKCFPCSFFFAQEDNRKKPGENQSGKVSGSWFGSLTD